MSLLLLFSKGGFWSHQTGTMALGAHSSTQGVLPVGIGVNDIHILPLCLGAYALSLSILRSSIEEGESFTCIQTHTLNLADNFHSVLNLLNSLSAGVEDMQVVKNEIMQSVLNDLQVLKGEIAITDYVQSQQVISECVGEISAMLLSVTYAIYLDGKNIKRRVISASIESTEDSVHNSINITSSDADLFRWGDPTYLNGSSRVEVRVEGRVLYFLVEKRSGTEKKFTLWGRSLSAVEDMPYSAEITYSLSEPTSAQYVAESLPDTCAVTWECPDWILPESFEFRGTPLQGILKIAQVIGAKVRSDDDGSIIIRNAFPVRPVNMCTAAIAVSYNRDNIIDGMSYAEIDGQGYNEIEVFGVSSNDALPTLVLEESSPYRKEIVHVRAYWDGIYPPGARNTQIIPVVTAGVQYLGSGTEKIIEIVYFKNGVASTAYPIYNYSNLRWIGTSLGAISYNRYSNNLIAEYAGNLETLGFAVAEVTYYTVFGRYALYGHDVEELMLVLSHNMSHNVNVLVKSSGEYDESSYVAPSISDPLLTDDNVAALRGINFLDATKYDSKVLRVNTPYDDGAKDGAIVAITDSKLNCSGAFYVKSSSIVFSGAKVINSMEVVQWRVL